MQKNFGTKEAIMLVLEFGLIIVIPLLFFVNLAKWLDSRYDSPAFMYAGLVLALLTSVIWLYRKINQINKLFTGKDN